MIAAVMDKEAENSPEEEGEVGNTEEEVKNRGREIKNR